MGSLTATLFTLDMNAALARMLTKGIQWVVVFLKQIELSSLLPSCFSTAKVTTMLQSNISVQTIFLLFLKKGDSLTAYCIRARCLCRKWLFSRRPF